ncbi:hypothetical protein EMCRGX_G010639 [Ephydatia muelleri]
MTDDSSVNVDSAYTKVVRYCARPPTKFTAKTDWELWLIRFDAYADEAKIGKGDRGKELLSLLDDEPFRLVYQNGLVESKDYSAVCECLTLRYGKTGMGLEWQMKLQCRVQRPGESLLDFAGELRMIASKAFPDWSNGQLEELVRNQFIQGSVSPTVQMQLMKDMPHSINDAVELARKLETAEQAQRCLCQERRDQIPASALLPVGRGVLEDKLDRLTADVQKLTERMAGLSSEPLSTDKSEPRRRTPLRCWHCRQPGHGAGGRGLPPAVTPQTKDKEDAKGKFKSVTFVGGTRIDTRSAPGIRGLIEHCSVSMLVDTGSAVTIIRADIWEKVSKCTVSTLARTTQAVVAANGKGLQLDGQVVLNIHVGGLHVDQLFLVARDLTQECLLGADFLCANGCAIDFDARSMSAGGEVVILQFNQLGPLVCDAVVMESISIPAMVATLMVDGKMCRNSNVGILEPQPNFMEHHGLAVAHSVAINRDGAIPMQMLNPGNSSITLHKGEKLGRFVPLEGPYGVHVVEASQGRISACEKDREVGPEIIESLIMGVEGLSDIELEQLRMLLCQFSSIISTSDSDIGRTRLVQHHIDPQGANPVKQPPRRLPFHLCYISVRSWIMNAEVRVRDLGNTGHQTRTADSKDEWAPTSTVIRMMDLTLWLTQYELYVRQAKIPEDQWTCELLSRLEDTPFRIVTQQGLAVSTDYQAVVRCLKAQYYPDRNELEWQFKLQQRTQRTDEKLGKFVGVLTELADKAHPQWSRSSDSK